MFEMSVQCGADVVDYVKFDTGKAYSRDDILYPLFGYSFCLARWEGKVKEGRRIVGESHCVGMVKNH